MMRTFCAIIVTFLVAVGFLFCLIIFAVVCIFDKQRGYSFLVRGAAVLSYYLLSFLFKLDENDNGNRFISRDQFYQFAVFSDYFTWFHQEFTKSSETFDMPNTSGDDAKSSETFDTVITFGDGGND